MGEDPRTIRAEIEETRERMGDTVDALAYKADVKTRAKESVSEKVDSLKEKVTGAKDTVTGTVTGAKDSVADSVSGARDTVSDRTPSAGEVKYKARRAKGMAEENPLGLALGGLAIGFVAGLLVPSTRIEDEKVGPVADQVKERAAQTGQQALEHGKAVAQDVAEQAKETARESGQEHASQVADHAKQQAQETREQVSSS